jgi:hypothetical protein
MLVGKAYSLACGAVAAPVFVAGYGAIGRARSGYDAKRQPISELARGSGGWSQSVNFLAAGLLLANGATGIRAAERDCPSGRRSVWLGAMVVGAGLAGAGAFATDTAAEVRSRGLSRRGAAHVICSLPAFAAMPLISLSISRGIAAEHPRSSGAYRLAAKISIASITLMSAGVASDNMLSARAGTIQRAAVVSGLGPISAYCLQLMRSEAHRRGHHL